MNISDIINNPSNINQIFGKALHNLSMRSNVDFFHSLAPYVTTPYLIYAYAKNIVRGRVNDQLEEIILKEPRYCYEYVIDVIKERCEKFERVISRDACWSTQYAKNVLKGPFIKGEEAIIGDGHYLREYFWYLEKIKQLNEFYNRHPNLKNYEYFKLNK